MRKIRHRLTGIATLIICLSVVGCGHGGAISDRGNGNQTATADGTSGTDGGGPPGAPGPDGSADAKGAPVGNGSNGGHGGNDGSKARGAPIKIPAIVFTQGAPIDAATNLMIIGEPDNDPKVIGLAEECGGQLCVTLRNKPGTGELADNYTACDFLGETDPPMDSVVHAGDTIWLLTGTKPCSSPSDGDGSSGDSEATDSGSPSADTGSPPADAGSPAADAGPSPADSTSP
jgi:hypothetical protein